MSRLDHLNRFYSSLGGLEQRVAGFRRLSDCSGRMHWPKRGIYFFTQPGENRTNSGHGPRIVRVGTHAVTATSKTTLWDHLYQHKGYVRSEAGNHRGSIFRLLLGTALIERDGLVFPTWDTHRKCPHRGVEPAFVTRAQTSESPAVRLGVRQPPDMQAAHGHDRLRWRSGMSAHLTGTGFATRCMTSTAFRTTLHYYKSLLFRARATPPAFRNCVSLRRARNRAPSVMS